MPNYKRPRVQTFNGHAHLVRAALCAVEALQQCGDVLPAGAAYNAVEIALLAMDKALHGQRVQDERVVIAVRCGIAQVESKTAFVDVTIKDYDNEQ